MRKTIFITFALLMIVCGSALASGKITVDPNAGINRTQAEEWSADARLSQKVTYEVRHKAVKAILADLSDMTGITFNAGYNKNDWQVRDRKMNIFAKDITIADLISSIARVMKFKWSVNEDEAPWTYRLYMDRTTLVAANAELSTAQKQFDETLRRKRAEFIDMIENWNDDLSSDEMESLRKDNPYLYWLHNQGAGAAIKGLFDDIPGMKENLLNQERDMYYPMSSLTQETQQLVLNTAKKLYLLKGKRYAGNGESFPEEAEKAFSTGRMWFDFVPDELGWKVIAHRKYGGIGLYVGDQFFGMEPYLADPANPVMQMHAEIDLQASEKHISMEEAWKQNISDFQSAAVKESKTIEEVFPSEPVVEHPDEPDIHKKIQIKLEKKDWVSFSDLEAATAAASGFAVVSDSYKLNDGYATVGESETEIKDILDTICKGYFYNWEKHGPIIELRSREWFKKRTTQIPDEWVERWRTNLKKLGYMSIDDYAQIAQLTGPQIVENLGLDEDFYRAEMFDSAYANQIWLIRLYASLSDSQKKSIYSQTGLSLLSFSPDQWDLLRKACKNFAVEPDKVSGMLSCTVFRKEKEAPEYTFRLFNTDGGGLELESWIVTTLAYHEPEKAEQEPAKANEKKGEEKKSEATSTST